MKGGRKGDIELTGVLPWGPPMGSRGQAGGSLRTPIQTPGKGAKGGISR